MHVCLSSCALHLSALLHCKIASHFIRRCCRSFFCPAHSLTPDRVFTPFFPSFLFFIRFFLSCSSVFAIEYAIGSRASICLSQKRNFWAKCQLCTLNIYRKAIYVIAWFSSTNIHALENCLISGSIFPSILCIIRSYFSSIANWWFDLLCVCVCMYMHSQFTFVLHQSAFVLSSALFGCCCCCSCRCYASNQLIVRFGKVFRSNFAAVKFPSFCLCCCLISSFEKPHMTWTFIENRSRFLFVWTQFCLKSER